MAAEEPEVVRPRVIIANINRGQVGIHFMHGVINSLIQGHARCFTAVESGPYLDAGRNKAIVSCLRATEDGFFDLPHAHPLLWDWLLFIDSDIEFTPADIDTLLAPTLHPSYLPTMYPVIGGVYINPFDGPGVPGEPEGQDGYYGPVVYEWVEIDTLPGVLAGTPTWTTRRISADALATLPPVNEAWNPPGDNGTPSPVTEVCAVGTGFMAIHVSLIDHMQKSIPEPMVWFEEPIRGGVHYGEDLGFCLRVRDLGYPVLVNRACKVIHHKTTKLI